MQQDDIRRRHKRANPKGFYSMIITIAVICVLLIMGWNSAKPYLSQKFDSKPSVLSIPFPETFQGELYKKTAFVFSYVEEFELVEWVAYRLTESEVKSDKIPRNQDFQPDPFISTESAHYWDYKNSGYRIGHLVPSYDMAYNKKAMDETFLMSNVVPMKEEFNDGIWHELEKDVRDWAVKYKVVDVVTGPVFKNGLGEIGDNKVFVPRYFYKVIFSDENSEPRCIGFLFDQTNTEGKDPMKYNVPIDSIEKVTGLDFFSNRYGTWEKEIELEGKIGDF